MTLNKFWRDVGRSFEVVPYCYVCTSSLYEQLYNFFSKFGEIYISLQRVCLSGRSISLFSRKNQDKIILHSPDIKRRDVDKPGRGKKVDREEGSGLTSNAYTQKYSTVLHLHFKPHYIQGHSM